MSAPQSAQDGALLKVLVAGRTERGQITFVGTLESSCGRKGILRMEVYLDANPFASTVRDYNTQDELDGALESFYDNLRAQLAPLVAYIYERYPLIDTDGGLYGSLGDGI